MVWNGACDEGPEAGILVVSNQRKSPLQKRACPYPSPLARLGDGAVRLVGVTACQEYTTRQTLKQEHSAPSLSRTR